jgi:hypothetical protein
LTSNAERNQIAKRAIIKTTTEATKDWINAYGVEHLDGTDMKAVKRETRQMTMSGWHCVAILTICEALLKL